MPSWIRGQEPPERAVSKVASFQTKGLVYQGALAFYDRTIAGGSAEVIMTLIKMQSSAESAESTRAIELKEFFAQSFVAGAWYDALPISPLSQAAAHVAGMAYQRLIRDNAAWMAQRDLNGVYKAIVRLASVEMVAKRLPALSLRYFDFGGTEETSTTANSLTAVRTGIPHLLGDWFMHCTEGFVPVALALAGAADVRVRCTRLDAASGTSTGQMVAFRFDVNWA